MIKPRDVNAREKAQANYERANDIGSNVQDEGINEKNSDSVDATFDMRVSDILTKMDNNLKDVRWSILESAGHDRATPCPTPPTLEEPNDPSQEANFSQGEPSSLQPGSQLENPSKDDNSSKNGGENSSVSSSKRKREESVNPSDEEKSTEEKEKLSVADFARDKSSEDNPSQKKIKSDDDDNSLAKPSARGGGGNSGGSGSGPSGGVEPEISKSPVDYVMEQQASEMPSIFESDGGD